MYTSVKHLIAITAACIAIVALALAFRIYHTLPAEWQHPFSRGINGVTLTTDNTFYEGAATSTNQKPKASPVLQAAGPVVSAAAYLVGNVQTGTIYFEKNSSMVLPVASMSKLITAFVSTETIPQDKRITITEAEADVASDTSRIAAGETYTARELLYPMLLNSSNVAAEALASSSNRAKFLENMSSYAWEIGMPSTYFADPSGLSPQNVSTARDFFNLAKYLYKSRPDILALTRTRDATTATTSDHGAHSFASIHPFIEDPRFIGGKTGHTPEARDTMLTILNIGNQPIAFIVLASENRKADTDVLAAYYSKNN